MTTASQVAPSKRRTTRRVRSTTVLATVSSCAMLLLFVMGAGLLVTPAQAQTSYGAVVGTVTDSSGAAVLGASVTLTNNGTAAKQETKTGPGGTYSFVNLIPGAYSVTVTHAGFQSYTRNDVDVQIGGTVRADAALQVGNVAQSVTVTAGEAPLQTDSASLSGVIEGRQVQDAPLNGRNVNNLLDFVPGVTPGGGTQGSTMANGGSGNFQAGGQTQAIAYGNYQIGGAFSGQSLFFIDGVESNIVENNVNSLVLTQDAVQEFRVSTNNVSAEFGGYGGGVIQISSKSGTNQFHGNAYEYFRNTALDANDWFSNHDGLGKSPLHQNQYGANLGGPVLKNKLFFFFSWEHESLISASPMSATVPTSSELKGDFSADPQTIYCPATGSYGCTPGQPMPGNKLTFIDPIASTILKLEAPDESRVTQTPFSTNFHASAPIEGYQDQYNARIDASLGKDVLFARYTFWNPHNGPSDPFGNKTGAGPTGNYTQEAVLGDNHVFNPTTIADLRLSYLENYNFQYPLSDGFDMSSISPAYGTIQSQSINHEGQLPALGIQGYGIGEESSQLFWNNNVWAISGSMTKIIGKHTIKAGGNWGQVLWEAYGNQGSLTLNALPSFTAASTSSTTTGNALASFMLGIPSSTNTSSQVTTHSFLHNYGLFVEDTYQTSPKLTITAGVRWEQPGAFSEENNLDAILLPHAPVTIGGISSFVNPVGSTTQLKGAAALVASPQYSSRREESLHWKLFSPRVGFAYRYNGRTVIRSGYGISFFPPEVDQDGPQLGSLTRAFTAVTNTPGQSPTATVANPLPNGITVPAGHTQTALNNMLGADVWARIPSQPMGYSQQWNFAIERAFDSRSTATVAYAGSKGTHLIIASPYTGSGLQLNQLPDQYDSMGPALLTQVPNPFFGILPSGSPTGGATVPEGYLLLPYPQYPQGVLQQDPRYGSSTYHALQASYVRHFAHEGILQGAYTWGKLLSNTDNTSAFQDGQGGTAVPQDNYNLRAEKSLSEQDIASSLVINYGIDLPFGAGQPYLSSVRGAANQIIGGWRIDGITTFRSGVPIAIIANPNVLSTLFGAGTPPFGPGSGIIRPNYTAGCSKSALGSPHSAARANEWFNTSCFSQPGSFSFGNEPRVDPAMRTDGQDNFDVSFDKSFDIWEQAKLKFSAQIFDLFNHPQFAEPNTTLGPGFGEVTHQTNLPRTVQFALRFSF
jgi:hypothetical protein